MTEYSANMTTAGGMRELRLAGCGGRELLYYGGKYPESPAAIRKRYK